MNTALDLLFALISGRNYGVESKSRRNIRMEEEGYWQNSVAKSSL
jgi:hypothetical protein